MPRGIPTLVEPWIRINWKDLNRGQKLFAIQEWQSYLARSGRALPDIPSAIAVSLGIPETYICKKASNILSSLWTDPVDRRSENLSRDISPTAGSDRSPEEDTTSGREEDFFAFSHEDESLPTDGTKELQAVTDILEASYGERVPPVLHPQRQRVRTDKSADQSMPNISLYGELMEGVEDNQPVRDEDTAVPETVIPAEVGLDFTVEDD
jgi:hypothetical protein